METLRKLFVTLGLDWDKAGFAQAITAANLLEGAAKALVNGFKELVGVVTSSITGTTEYGSAVNDASAATGVASKALQELHYAGMLTGASNETVNSTLIKLSHTMGQAVGGSKEAKAAFAALGVQVTDSNGKLRPVEAVFTNIIEKLGKVKNPADRAGKALDVLGNRSKELLPLAAAGGEALEQMRSQFNDLGLGLDEDGVAAADRFGDSMDTVREVVNALKRDLGGPLIEALQPVVDSSLEWVAANRELIRTKITEFAKLLIAGAKLLWATFKALYEITAALAKQWRFFGVVIGSFLIAKFVLLNAALLETLVAFGLNTAAAGLFGAASLAAAGKAAIAWLTAAAPVVLMTAALVLAALAAEDLYVFLTGGDSVIGELGPKWTKFIDEWSKPHPGDNMLMEGLRAIVHGLTDIQGVALPALKAAWADMWSFAKNTARGFFLDVQLMIGQLRETLRSIFAGKITVESLARSAIPGASTVLDAGDSIDRFFGGASSPAAAAESSGAAAPQVIAPRFNASIQVVAPAGASTESVGVMLEDRLSVWWDGKMREATATAGE